MIKDDIRQLQWDIINSDNIDSAIRFFIYVLIFWLPYSPAVVETCVVFCIVLWLLKRYFTFKNSKKSKCSNIKDKFIYFIRKFQPVYTPINIPVVLFLFFCIVSIFRSSYFTQSFHGFFTKICEWFIVYFIIIEVFGNNTFLYSRKYKHPSAILLKAKRQIYIAIGIFVFTSLATALDGLLQFFIFHKDIFFGRSLALGNRATAGFKTPNGLGAYLAVAIPITMSLVMLKRKKMRYRILNIVAFMIMGFALYLTFSRGAWLGVLIGILVLFLLFIQAMKKVVVFRLLLVGSVFLLILLAGIKHTNLINNRRNTIQWRIGVWEDSLKMVKERPLFGRGVNTFMREFESYRRDKGCDPTYAHNSYLQLLVETGMAGLLSFLWIIYRLFYTVISKIKNECPNNEEMRVISIGLIAGLISFLVHSFFDNHMYSLQLSVYFWFIAGLVVATTSFLCVNN